MKEQPNQPIVLLFWFQQVRGVYFIHEIVRILYRLTCISIQAKKRHQYFYWEIHNERLQLSDKFKQFH